MTGVFSQLTITARMIFVLVNSYQTITANNNNVSAESKAFADATLAKIISLVEVEEAIAA